MADPKIFKGPEGYTFTLYAGDARPGVIVASPGAPLDPGTWIPACDLDAFVAWKRESELGRAYARAVAGDLADLDTLDDWQPRVSQNGTKGEHTWHMRRAARADRVIVYSCMLRQFDGWVQFDGATPREARAKAAAWAREQIKAAWG